MTSAIFIDKPKAAIVSNFVGGLLERIDQYHIVFFNL